MFAGLKRLDVLVNNAAMQNRGAFLDLASGDFDRVLAVNLRAPFLCGQLAARVMRNTLVNHALARAADKRGSGKAPLLLSTSIMPSSKGAIDAVDLDEALKSLAALDPRKVQVVEMRFFGGLTLEETAAAMGISTGTVKREWVMAKGFLHRALTARA